MKKFVIDRRVSLALVFALGAEATTATWWIATRTSELNFQGERLSHLELTQNTTEATQQKMLERMARLEERMDAQINLLSRIDKEISAITTTTARKP